MKPTIETWDRSKIDFYASNPRRNDHAVTRMVKSLKEYGWVYPVLVRSSGEIIDGHLRVKAADQLKQTDIPVLICDGWTDEQVMAFRIMANKSADWAEWDIQLLKGEIDKLDSLNFDLTLTGFDLSELDLLDPQPIIEPDEPPKEKKSSNSVAFPDDAYLTVLQAAARLRDQEQDDSIPTWRCVELILADWLAS